MNNRCGLGKHETGGLVKASDKAPPWAQSSCTNLFIKIPRHRATGVNLCSPSELLQGRCARASEADRVRCARVKLRVKPCHSARDATRFITLLLFLFVTDPVGRQSGYVFLRFVALMVIDRVRSVDLG